MLMKRRCSKQWQEVAHEQIEIRIYLRQIYQQPVVLPYAGFGDHIVIGWYFYPGFLQLL